MLCSFTKVVLCIDRSVVVISNIFRGSHWLKLVLSWHQDGNIQSQKITSKLLSYSGDAII